MHRLFPTGFFVHIRQLFPGLAALSLLALLTACGPESGGPEAGTANLSEGRVVDPYITDAVLEEVAPDGSIRQSQSSPSDAEGRFFFEGPVTVGSTVRMKASLRGSHNGEPFPGVLKAQVGGDQEALVVSPLTTLVAEGIEEEKLLALLAESGITGLTAEDLATDPMAGLEELTSVDSDDRLALLQANMAANAWMAVQDDFSPGPEGLDTPLQTTLFRDIAILVRHTLNPRSFSDTAEKVAAEDTSSRPRRPMTMGEYIRAATETQQVLIAELRANWERNDFPSSSDMAVLAAEARESMLVAAGRYHQMRQGDGPEQNAPEAGEALPVAGQRPSPPPSTISAPSPPLSWKDRPRPGSAGRERG